MGKRKRGVKSEKLPVIALPAAYFGPRGYLGLEERLRVANLLERNSGTPTMDVRHGRFAPFDGPADPKNYVTINPNDPEERRRFRALPADHPLVRAWVNGKIDAVQFNAGNVYRLLFEKANDSGGRDSTQAVLISRTAASDRVALATVECLSARSAQGRIERRLGEGDKAIVTAFCGRAISMAAAVNATGTVYSSNGVVPRVREALDALAKAIRKAGVETGPDHGAVAQYLKKTA